MSGLVAIGPVHICFYEALNSFPGQCLLSCQNGGVLRNDTCGCNCSRSGVYGGTDCTGK